MSDSSPTTKFLLKTKAGVIEKTVVGILRYPDGRFYAKLKNGEHRRITDPEAIEKLKAQYEPKEETNG